MNEIVHYDSMPSSSQGVIHRADRKLIKMRYGLRGPVVSGWIIFEQPQACGGETYG
jgi:hypothetical protein